MAIGSVDEYWIIEGGKKTNTIGKLRLVKVEQNGLIGVTGFYHVLVTSHQRTDKLVNPCGFRF
jgi:hypothetical protein